MGFFNKEFLDARRREWESSIGIFQYQVDNTWYNANKDSSVIEDNKIICKVTIPVNQQLNKAHTISGIRALDVNGVEAGHQTLSIVRSGTQELLATFEFPIQEA